MKFQDKASIVVAALVTGAIVILMVAPVGLFLLKAANNGVGFEFPYVFWVAIYGLYAFAVFVSASDGSLFSGSKRRGFGH